MAEPVLEAIQLSKQFIQRAGIFQRTGQMIHAVDRVDCRVFPGERLGVVGQSGSGKTTLGRLLIGLLPPTHGEIRIQGALRSTLVGDRLRAMRRAMQMVFQDPIGSLDPRMNVEELLAEPLRLHRLALTTNQRIEQVEQLLKTVQLPVAYRPRLPRQLSGGERQRVGIARALALQPQVLICDEPIASLDVSVGAQILQLLRRLSDERRMALVFISHDLRAVAALCERIIVMREGRIVEHGPTDQLINHPTHPYTQLLIRCADLDLDSPKEIGDSH